MRIEDYEIGSKTAAGPVHGDPYESRGMGDAA
jgi:hypothetical protein